MLVRPVSREPLPIDALLEQIVQALRVSRALVLQADPGAGKTTRVPVALLEAGLAGDGEDKPWAGRWATPCASKRSHPPARGCVM